MAGKGHVILVCYVIVAFLSDSTGSSLSSSLGKSRGAKRKGLDSSQNITSGKKTRKWVHREFLFFLKISCNSWWTNDWWALQVDYLPNNMKGMAWIWTHTLWWLSHQNLNKLHHTTFHSKFKPFVSNLSTVIWSQPRSFLLMATLLNIHLTKTVTVTSWHSKTLTLRAVPLKKTCGSGSLSQPCCIVWLSVENPS